MPVPILLMVRELGLGGSERQLTEIARALDRAQFEPHVGCLKPVGFRSRELRAVGVPVVDFPVRSFASQSAFSGALCMRRYLRCHAIRLVHCFDVPMNLFGVPVARACGIHTVLSSQRASRTLVDRGTRGFLRITDRLSHGIVVNCKAVEKELAKCGVPPARIHLCYNGVDTSIFHAHRGWRPQQLSDAELVIGVVCALRPEKNLPTLLKAFSRVASLRPGLHLVVIGSGPERDQLISLSRELGIQNACLFQPAAANVAEWLRAIDIFVLPSLSEALSNSLMEAMACGCAVVASRTGGNPELVTHGRTGLLFEPGNVPDLAANLRLLAENASLRQNLSDSAAQTMARNFSLQASARRMAAIYSHFLKQQNFAEGARCAS